MDQNYSFGMIFYYFQNPKSIESGVVELIKEFSKCFSDDFTRLSETGDAFKAFKHSNIGDFIENQIRKHNFARSLFLSLTNAAKDSTPDQKILFWGRHIHEEFKSKTPNYLYFELPSRIDVDLCWHLFVESFRAVEFHLGLGNRVVSTNEELMSGSGSNAAKEVRVCNFFVQEFDASFRNLSYLEALENKTAEFLVQPSQFVGVGRKLMDEINYSAVYAASGVQENFEFYPTDEAYYLKANDTQQLVNLSEVFANHYATVEKPDMFWKQDQWDSWMEKTMGKTPGNIWVNE